MDWTNPNVGVPILVSLVAAFISIAVAIYTSTSSARRDHHRWLQEERRKAYVAFLTASRDAYEAITERGQKVGAPRIDSDYRTHRRRGHLREEQDPTDDELKEARAEIDRRLGDVRRAQDVLSIVGPRPMEELGKQVFARLSLDRGYYSPTGWTDRQKDRIAILARAEDTGNTDFLNQLRAAYAHDPVDVDEFRKAFHNHRLQGFWSAFTKAARCELDRPNPR